MIFLFFIVAVSCFFNLFYLSDSDTPCSGMFDVGALKWL